MFSKKLRSSKWGYLQSKLTKPYTQGEHKYKHIEKTILLKFKYHIRNIQPMALSPHASQDRMVKISQLKNHVFTENMRGFVCDYFFPFWQVIVKCSSINFVGDHIIFQC